MSSDSNGYGQQNSIYVPTNHQEANTGFPRSCGLLENVYSRAQSDWKPSISYNAKMNYFKRGPEKQASEQIKEEIVHAVALGSVRTGQDAKTVLYTAAGEKDPSWSLCQKVLGDTGGWLLGFWSWGFKGSKACYTTTEKGILASHEGVQAASEVISTEAQLLLTPWLPVLGYMC